MNPQHITIDGKVYQSKMFDLAARLFSESPERTLTADHATQILAAADDARSFTEIEKDTIRYILATYPTTGEGHAILSSIAPIDQRDKIKHVFVLMLENHSFDNIFGLSGIPGIVAGTSSNTNTYQGKTYHFHGPAPDQMTTDPGHEFLDVVQQLTGTTPKPPGKNAGYPYPAINNAGFVANYATSLSEKTGVPKPEAIGDVMKGFRTPSQLPVIHQLATEFAICDHWFSSLPGPTWPNRFFVHGASSAGLDDSPSTWDIIKWESSKYEGLPLSNGSIFDRLHQHNRSFRLFIDKQGDMFGGIPQVSSIKGIQILDVKHLPELFDLLGPQKSKSYDAPYTFIEPNYGDIKGHTYKGGSSQHPEDSMMRGEALIKSVYEAIRNSAIWESSMLIITYDEHGGFYDSVRPGPATPPGDNPTAGLNKHGFRFDRYGVRVPAVVISPYIRKGTVDHTVYDHASVPATLERLLGMPPLTNRDKAANDVLRLLTLPKPRTDCPTRLNDPVKVAERVEVALTEAEQARLDSQSIPESGNYIGFLHVLLKAELELSNDSEAASIMENFKQIKTMKDAQTYIERMHQQIDIARAKL